MPITLRADFDKGINCNNIVGMIDRKPYPSDLTDDQWRHLHILLPRKRGKGNHRSPQQKRELLNAILYVKSTGCQWNALPHDFPPHQTVYGYFRELSDAGVWQQINDRLRRGVRHSDGREPDPSVVIVDSQSVKTTEKRGRVVGSTAVNESKDENDISPSM